MWMFAAANLGPQTPRARIKSTDARHNAVQLGVLGSNCVDECVAGQQAWAPHFGNEERQVHDVESCIFC